MSNSIYNKTMNKIYISHRGNIHGPNPEYENTPDYIISAIQKGFDVEIDVRVCEKNKWWLGHDEGSISVDLSFFLEYKQHLWCHAKNLSALENLLNIKSTCLWHQNDYYTLTSNSYIWTYPGYTIGSKSIWVLPEQCPLEYYQIYFANCAGICSDYIGDYQ